MKLHGYKRLAPDQIVPDPQNPRTHSDAQIEQIRRSIREFGFTNPVLIDEDNGLIAGHGRLQAASLEGMGEIPAIIVAGLTEAQKRALLLADNQIAVNAGWDEELLRLNLQALQQEGVDLSIVGFTPDELAGILADITPVGLTDPDESPPIPEIPVSALGDTWQLGRHRIRCGDATKADDVMALLDGIEPHLMVTDPPYGVDYDPEWRAAAGVNKNRGKMGKVSNDGQSDWREAWVLFPGDVAYVWHAGKYASTVQESLESAQLIIRSQVIWAKDRFALSRGHYHWQHEPCWYAVRDGASGSWHGDRSQSTLWEISAREGKGLGHATQKPVECMRRPIENNSSRGQAVYDPFVGSGTTLIAGEMLGRAVYAMELNPAYVDVAVQRWQAFTGKTAKLESTGQLFMEVESERHASSQSRTDGQEPGGGRSLRRSGGAAPRHRKADRDQHAHAPQTLRKAARGRKGKGQRPGRQEPVSAGH